MRVMNTVFPTLNTVSSSDKVPTIAECVGIPKIIHQTFYDRTLPPELQKNVDRLKALNSDWEYRFYDDDDIQKFIKDNYPPVVWQYFCRIHQSYGAARADLFRYLLMYRCGGVYLDIKSSVNKPFSATLKPDDRYLLSHWKNGLGEAFQGWGRHDELAQFEHGEYQQWHIACTSGHPFLKAVIEIVLTNIDKYNPALHGTGKYGVLRVTGPIAYTLAISRLLSKHHSRTVDSQADLGFEYSIYKNTSHTGIFRSHYSTLTNSIVLLSSVKRNWVRLFQGMQRIKRSLAPAFG